MGLPRERMTGEVSANGHRPLPVRGRLMALGSAVPGLRVANSDIESFLDTSDEWIQSRTGIRERRVATPELTLLELAGRSARAALRAARLGPQDVDTVICSSSSPDATFPSLACRLQALLGCPQGPAFDIQAACTGAIYGMALANSMIASGLSRRVLLVSAELFTRLVDWRDRSTAVLFGDASGAMVIGGPEEAGAEILSFELGADGGGAWALDTMPFDPPAGPPSAPLPEYSSAPRSLGRVIRMNGREVFRFSTRILEQVVTRLAAGAGVAPAELGLIVPHQANSRILATAAGRLGIPFERLACNVDRYGNTSSASIPLALAETASGGGCGDGELVCLVAFGAGLTWGGALLRWHPLAVLMDDPAAAQPGAGGEPAAGPKDPKEVAI